uniref:THAP-type domain-containing protein n=1 Tax=Clastoptera arizonana TaxID=38151 RepID=A0A1B6E8J1_9HEMI
MPGKCCVTECKSNYCKPFVNIFLFPKDALTAQTWLRAIHRDDYELSANSCVCIKHFCERYIIRKDSITRPDGTVVTVKRDRLKLRDDAIPTIFENLPHYIIKDLPPERKDPDERRTKVEKLHQTEAEEKNV